MAATKHAQEVKNDTKEFITEALLQLLSKEKLSALTVSQVCKRAGVSRMAFYRNFDGLEEILYEYYQSKIADVFCTIHQNSQDSIKLEIQLNFFNVFGDVLLLAIDRGFETIIKQIFTEEIEKFYISDIDEYWKVFMSAGVYEIWRKWLLDGQQRPLQEIMELLKRFDVTRPI